MNDSEKKHDDIENEISIQETLIHSAIDVLKRDHNASVFHLARRLDLGYALASKLLLELERSHIVGPLETPFASRRIFV